MVLSLFGYFRLNVTGISAGTTAGTVTFTTGAYAPTTSVINVNSNSATGSAVPANAFYMGMSLGGNLTALTGTTATTGISASTGGPVTKSETLVYNGTTYDTAVSATTGAATTGTGLLGAGVLGIYNSSPPTITSGNYERLQLDSSGNLKVNIASGSGGSTQITDGTNTANILKSDGTAAGQNSQLVARTHLTVPFTTTTAQAVGTTDAANYSTVSVHTTSQGTGSTVSFQGSNDNTNWASVSLLLASAVGTSPAGTSTNATTIYSGPLNFRYFRLNVTGISAGTTAGTIEFLTSSYASPTSAISVGSNNGTGSAVPATAFYIAAKDNSGNLQGLNTVQANNFDSTTGGNLLAVGGIFNFNGSGYDRQRTATAAAATTGTGLLGAGVLGIYNSSPPSITSGNYERLQLDSSGNLKVNIAGGSGGSTQITDGTNTANVLSSTGTYTGQNAQLVAGSYQSQSFSVTSVTTGTSYDVGDYSWVSVQINTQYTGTTPTITFQGSNDNTNWSNIGLMISNASAAISTDHTTSAGVIYNGPLATRYFRLNFTGAYSSGTAAGTMTFMTLPRVFPSYGVNAAQNGTWNVGASSAIGSTTPGTAFYLGVRDSSGNLQGIGTASAQTGRSGPVQIVSEQRKLFTMAVHMIEPEAQPQLLPPLVPVFLVPVS